MNVQVKGHHCATFNEQIKLSGGTEAALLTKGSFCVFLCPQEKITVEEAQKEV